MVRIACAAVLAALLVSGAEARVHAYRLESLTLSDAEAEASFGGATTSEAFVTVSNAGHVSDRLVSASCACAQSVEMHRMWMDHNIMRMRPAPNGLEVPAGGTLALTKGRDHLMLVGLKRPLKPGMRVKMTLRFEHNGKATLDFPVKAPAVAGGHM
jgi:copper(I)-binding protein